MRVNKVTWEGIGHVSAPGRYIYTFGWLTVTADDLAVWKCYPGAAFTLLAAPATDDSGGEEYHLGAFDPLPTSASSTQ